MIIVNNDKYIDAIINFIKENYLYKKIAFFVDDEKTNINLVREIQKKLENTIITNSALTEDVAFCFICGNYKFQQDCLIEITYNNIDYGFIISNLSQSSFLSPYIQDEKLIKIYSPKIIVFDKNLIKNQDFSSNLAVFSYIQSKRVSIFELEFYSRVFNTNYIFDFKNKVLAICDAFNGLMDIKLKNINTANLKVLEFLVKYLKLQDKYDILYNQDTIFEFSNALTSNLYSNYYENMFIASVFATNLYQKYFTLSFNNNYSFDYSKQLNFCLEDFTNSIEDFKKSEITDNLNYKIIVNKNYFKEQLLLLITKNFLNKYDFLCIFDDFGYNLVKKLEKCNFKSCILKVANLKGTNLFKQIRNYGLLDF